MEMETTSSIDEDEYDAPAGFRFHPTDEELVGFYLLRKVDKKPISNELIKQIDVYKYDPWDLPALSTMGDKEWYFFCTRGRKYRNSSRPNRLTPCGFWKATGNDRPIYSAGREGRDCIGVKKSLVYYLGRTVKKGDRTNWRMHEFRLPAEHDNNKSTKHIDAKSIAQEAEVWALCRIFQHNVSYRKCTPMPDWEGLWGKRTLNNAINANSKTYSMESDKIRQSNISSSNASPALTRQINIWCDGLSEHQTHEEIDRGGSDETCLFDEFLAYYTSVAYGEVSNPTPSFAHGADLNVFWHPNEDASESNTGSASDSLLNYVHQMLMGTEAEGLQEKIKSVLKSASFWTRSILLQFWAPIKNRDQNHKVLTTSGQPFGIGNFYKGLCRYRNRCVGLKYGVDQVNHNIGIGTGMELGTSQQQLLLGPPGRVFNQRIPEFCPDIRYYSTQEFPLRDYAISECGIKEYWALPLFEQHDGQHCIGVLEFVAFEDTDIFECLNSFYLALEHEFLQCPSSYFHKCSKIRKDILSPQLDIQKVLKFVREVHQLPLIQAWVPCMCDDASKTIELFCEWRNCDGNIEPVVDIIKFRNKYGTVSLPKGKGLVGKAYSLNKLCFFRDISQFSISDYPFVHLTRRAGLTACFAIPLHFVHHTLDALLLEIFLPPEESYPDGMLVVFKSILSTVAQGFSRLNGSLGLNEGEEFSVEVSHSDDDNFDFFDIHRSGGSMNRHVEPLGNAREELQTQSPHQPRMIGEITVTNDETNAIVGKKHSSSVAHSKRQDMAETSMGVYTNAESRITLDVLKPHFGGNLVDAAESLGVSRSKLKRTCRSLGIERWPSHKRKKVDHHNHSNAMLQTGTVELVEEVIQGFEEGNPRSTGAILETEAASAAILNPTGAYGKSIALGSESGEKCTSMVVKATHGENTVMFPLPHNSGIERLNHEVAKRFKLQVENFTIKYEDEDGDWIMISCDEDLHYHIEYLKSLGHSRIKLSVFSFTL